MINLFKNKYFVAIILLTIILVLIFISIFIENRNQKNLVLTESMRNGLQQIDQNYDETIGVLPDSRFYSIKIWQEGLIVNFLGNKKNNYLLSLQRRRIIELATVLSANSHQDVIYIIEKYKNNLKLLNIEQIDQNSTDIIKVYNLLSVVRSNTELFPELDAIAGQTYELVSPYLIKDKNLVEQNYISGQVISKTELSLVIKFNNQMYNVRNVNNADFIDTNSNVTNQTINDLQINDQVRIIPISKQIYLPTDKTYGNLSADKIMVEKNDN
jgi:hypothetical protein